MELVRGVPITKYCDDNHLTVRERLALIVPVCKAVQHAHQKGIIHRDLKPSNVLVCLSDSQPVPKVIDFGVAKAVEQRLTERTMFTEYGQIIGTFEYMSPEQAEMSQLGVDTRSDIYSLGVMLYELLTGSTPLQRQRLRAAGLNEMLKMIKEEEPPKPSMRLSELGRSGSASGTGHARQDGSSELARIAAARRTEPLKLRPLLQGELDWVVMKCLEKDRARRYDTANGLARDIERYLHDEPVEAGPPGAGYRLRKLARKHRTALSVAGVVALLLVLGGGGSPPGKRCGPPWPSVGRSPSGIGPSRKRTGPKPASAWPARRWIGSSHRSARARSSKPGAWRSSAKTCSRTLRSSTSSSSENGLMRPRCGKILVWLTSAWRRSTRHSATSQARRPHQRKPF